MIVRVFTAFGGTHGEGVSFSKHPDYPLDRHTLTGGNENEVEISRDYHSESDAHMPSKRRDFFKDTKHGPPSLQKITDRQFRECQVGLIPRKLYGALVLVLHFKLQVGGPIKLLLRGIRVAKCTLNLSLAGPIRVKAFTSLAFSQSLPQKRLQVRAYPSRSSALTPRLDLYLKVEIAK
ncbi:hypothetical protein ARMGADRAFT_1070216 [Armillaria gallica]|uniref:Uncharacterized protein n=1 Tax=Armillaria gallica TaxID=47427 RepID=A0A2H3EC73_ARMGA|nr:hypothetical protein ARMGADRAFT_1070216 [Armillaria gallica]